MTKLNKDSAIYTQISPELWEFCKENVFSNLGKSGVYFRGRENDTSTLSIMIAFIETGGNRGSAFKTMSALEKASQLTTLPSEGLKNIAYTSDLKDEWEWQRFWSLLLAKCFFFALLGRTEEPLKQEREETFITIWDAKLIEQSAYRYEALYTLIRKGFKYLRQSFSSNLNKKSPWDIFFEIAREQIDFYFVIRASDFQQFLIDTWIPPWRKLAEQQIDRKDLTPLLETQKHFHSQKLLEVLAILEKKAQRDVSLRGRLTAYFNESIELADLFVGAFEARDSSGKFHKSEQWRHGERLVFHNNQPLKPCYKT